MSFRATRYKQVLNNYKNAKEKIGILCASLVRIKATQYTIPQITDVVLVEYAKEGNVLMRMQLTTIRKEDRCRFAKYAWLRKKNF